jgi:hypothetical protein
VARSAARSIVFTGDEPLGVAAGAYAVDGDEAVVEQPAINNATQTASPVTRTDPRPRGDRHRPTPDRISCSNQPVNELSPLRTASTTRRIDWMTTGAFSIMML